MTSTCSKTITSYITRKVSRKVWKTIGLKYYPQLRSFWSLTSKLIIGLTRSRWQGNSDGRCLIQCCFLLLTSKTTMKTQLLALISSISRDSMRKSQILLQTATS
jgi:hypothetical protein